MFCNKCGKENPEEGVFCLGCGNQLKPTPEESPVETKEVEAPVDASTPVEEPTVNAPVQQEPSEVNVSSVNEVKEKKKINKLVFIIPIIIILIVVIGIFGYKFIKNKLNAAYSNKSGIELISKVKSANDNIKYIGGTFTDVKVTDESSAYEALEQLKDDLKFNNVKEEFTTESIETSKDITYYRFHQKYKDVEVYGTNLIISVNKSGKVLSMNGYYVPDINIDVDAKKTEEEVGEIVKKDIAGENPTILINKKNIYENSDGVRLVYNIVAFNNDITIQYIVDANNGEIINKKNTSNYASYDYEGNGLNGPVKVTIDEFKDVDIDPYKTQYRIYDPNRNINIIDYSGTNLAIAATLAVLAEEAKKPIEKYTLYEGFTKFLDYLGALLKKDTMTGKIENKEFIYKNNTEEDKKTVEEAITALKAFEDIYDYYYNKLGRKSYDNNGGFITVNIGLIQNRTEFNEKHDNNPVAIDIFSDKPYRNACWHGYAHQFFVGEWNDVSFTKSLDVLGHEFTHAVVSYTAAFTGEAYDPNKANENAALNEGIADIIGGIIEGKNWDFNESIETIRSAEDPLKYKYPSAMDETYYYPDGYLNNGYTVSSMLSEIEKEEDLSPGTYKKIQDFDNGGEHQNSTVVSHSAYLMYKNGAFNTLDDVAVLWYNSLFLMNSHSNFEDCALAVVQTAKNLGYSDDKVEIIYNAFIETKMLKKEDVELSGIIKSNKKLIKDAEITIKSKEDNKEYTFKSDKNGEFKATLKTGTYEITVKKTDFKTYKKTITITGDTNLEIELALVSDNIKNRNSDLCTTDNCHTVIIYQLEGNDNKDLLENAYIFEVDDGTVIGTDWFVQTQNIINNKMGIKMNFKYDNGKFYMETGGYTVDYAYYYRGTDTVFDFNQPIKEDIEIEVKMLDGLLDNQTLMDISEKFKNFR